MSEVMSAWGTIVIAMFVVFYAFLLSFVIVVFVYDVLRKRKRRSALKS